MNPFKNHVNHSTCANPNAAAWGTPNGVGRGIGARATIFGGLESGGPKLSFFGILLGAVVLGLSRKKV